MIFTFSTLLHICTHSSFLSEISDHNQEAPLNGAHAVPHHLWAYFTTLYN